MAFTSLFALQLLLSFHLVQSQGSAPLLSGASSHEDDSEAGTEQVTLSAAGTVQRTSSMMRRHEEASDRHHHNHHHSHPKVMFKALDLNGDGLVSTAELKSRAKNADFHIPKMLMEQISEDNNDSGISYEEFLKGVDHVVNDHALHHHASIHKHLGATPKEGTLLEARDAERTVQGNPPAPDEEDQFGDSTTVDCGGHSAPTCIECTRTDAFGGMTYDHGDTWCHGECEFVGGECKKKCAIDSGTESSDAQNLKPSLNSSATESEIPQQSNAETSDVLNPKITAKDEKVISKAAASGITEAKKEAEQDAGNNKESESDDVDVWLIVVVCMSVVLGMCAIASIAALVAYCYLPASHAKSVDTPLTAEGEEVDVVES